MKLHIQLLERGDDMRQFLKRDGWSLEPEKDDCVSASHPQVATELDARRRLSALGLLTSRLLRIEFPFRFSPVRAERLGERFHRSLALR